MWQKPDNKKGLWMWTFPNFKRSEFRCPCCGWDDIDQLVPTVLQGFRDYLNSTYPVPSGHKEYQIIITSGCRCPTRNAKVHGKENSQHLLGKAADFIVPGLSVVEVMKRLAQFPLAQTWVGYVEPAGGSAVACHMDVRKPNTQALRRWQRVGGIEM